MRPWLEETFSGAAGREASDSLELDARIDAFQKSAAYPRRQIERTENRAWLAERLPRKAIGAEIGVFRGHFAEVICQLAEPRLLYLIDPRTLGGETFNWGAAYTNNKTLMTIDAYEEAKLRVTRGGAKHFVMVQGYFPECARAIQHPLDWAYLDASHSYEDTVAELEALETLMNPMGVIAGDDWSPAPSSRHHGVFRAVQEFAAHSRWKIVMCGYLGQWMLRRY
jgi:Methyltransferase domain